MNISLLATYTGEEELLWIFAAFLVLLGILAFFARRSFRNSTPMKSASRQINVPRKHDY